MLTLEEAIKQYEQFLNVYENHNPTESQEVREVIEQLTTELREWREPKKVDNCEGCVKELDKRYLLAIKQLAAWLRELKERREEPKIIRCCKCEHSRDWGCELYCTKWVRYTSHNGYCHRGAERSIDDLQHKTEQD